MATPVVTSVTAGALIRDTLNALGDLVASGTATGGSTTTIVDKNNLARFADSDSRLITGGVVASVFIGTNAGASRLCTAFTNSTGTATVVAFASAIDTTSQYGFHARWSLEEALRGLEAARQLLIIDPAQGKGCVKETGPVEEIVYGNALTNGVMYRWTNGVSAAPDGWTLAGTVAAVARESTITIVGQYSAKLTSDGTNAAYLYQTITPLSRWRGRNVRMVALFQADVADRASVRIGQGNSGTITTIGSAVTAGTANAVKYADVSAAFDSAVSSAPPSSLTLQFAISAGSAVNCYCAFGYIEDPDDRDEYDIDADENLVVLDGDMYASDPVGSSQNGALAFPTWIKPHAWDIVHAATRRVKFNLARGEVRKGSIIRYTGYKAHAALSATTTTWAGPIRGIVRVAAAILKDQKQSPSAQPQISNAAAPDGYETVDYAVAQVIAKDGIPFKPGWVMVEPLV